MIGCFLTVMSLGKPHEVHHEIATPWEDPRCRQQNPAGPAPSPRFLIVATQGQLVVRVGVLLREENGGLAFGNGIRGEPLEVFLVMLIRERLRTEGEGHPGSQQTLGELAILVSVNSESLVEHAHFEQHRTRNRAVS